MENSLEQLSQNPSAGVAIQSTCFAPLGNQIRVWIETTEVPNHPRLVRRLKANSAVVVHDPRDARLILVNGSSVAGRKLLRDWADDTSKICLDFSWAQRSIDAGKPLLLADNWGSCRLYDDGREIDEDEDELEEPPTKPPPPTQLPTPRPTPSGLSTTSSLQFLPQHSPSPPNRVSSNSDPAVQLAQPPQFTSPKTWPSPSPQNAKSAAMLASFGQPSSQGHSMTPTPQMIAMFDHWYRQQLSEQQVQQESISQALHSPSQHQISLPLTQHIFSSSQPPPQSRQSSTTQEPMDRQQSISTSHNTNDSFGKPFLLQNASAEQPILHATQSIPVTADSPTTSGEEPPSTLDDSLAIVGSEAWNQGSNNAPDRAEPEIFEHELGKPIKFFVQIHMKNRTQVTKAIKRRKGKIISAMNEADYAILNSRSSDFDSIRHEADFHGTPTLIPSFVLDSDEKSVFLAFTDYLIAPAPTSTPSSGKKRKPDIRGSSTPSAVKKAKKSAPYTDDEKAEFAAYIRRLLKKTPDMPIAEFGAFLHQRMPTHSIEAWKAYCWKHKMEIQQIRSRAEKAKLRTMMCEGAADFETDFQEAEDAQPEAGPSNSNGPPELPHSPYPEAQPMLPKSEPFDQQLPASNSDELNDFYFATQFFASGAAEEGSEDEVWQIMTERRSCTTAVTWKEFCSLNWQRISQQF